jgi:hypothetical protein
MAIPIPFPILPIHFFTFLKEGLNVFMKEGVKLGNNEMDGVMLSEGATDVEGTIDGCVTGNLVGTGLPSGDVVIGGRTGLLVGLAVGDVPVGRIVSFLIGISDGMIDGIRIGESVGTIVIDGAFVGTVIGAVVVTGAKERKSSARHVV